MTQNDRILGLLLQTPNEFISAWDIVTKCRVLHYTECVRLLRKKGNVIENKTEWKIKDGQRVLYSWYRLVIPTPTEKKTIKEKILDFTKNIIGR